MSIRFLPKSRASRDQMPGPSMASAAPTTASTMQVRRLSALERAVHTSTITTNTPAIGVKKPIRRRTPLMVARDCHMIPCHSGAISISATPSWVRTIPAPNRRSRRPLPGQPLGNMENSRCREGLNNKVRESAAQSNPQKPGSGYTSFEGLQFDDSALQPDGDCVGSVVRAKFREDVLDVSLNGFLGDGQFIGDQFVGVSGGNGSKNLDFPWG